MESHVGAHERVSIPVAAVAEPGSDEYIATVDDYPDRGALWVAVLSDCLYVDLKLAVEDGECLSVEGRRLRMVGQ